MIIAQCTILLLAYGIFGIYVFHAVICYVESPDNRWSYYLCAALFWPILMVAMTGLYFWLKFKA